MNSDSVKSRNLFHVTPTAIQRVSRRRGTAQVHTLERTSCSIRYRPCQGPISWHLPSRPALTLPPYVQGCKARGTSVTSGCVNVTSGAVVTKDDRREGLRVLYIVSYLYISLTSYYQCHTYSFPPPSLPPLIVTNDELINGAFRAGFERPGGADCSVRTGLVQTWEDGPKMRVQAVRLKVLQCPQELG